MLSFAATNVMATTTIIAPCDSTTHESKWYTIEADASRNFVIEAGSTSDASCNIQTTAWSRNHSTITCFVSGYTNTHTSYTCHNWNTIWGDAWKVSFSYMACPLKGCTTSKEEKAMIQNIKESLDTKEASLMRSK